MKDSSRKKPLRASRDKKPRLDDELQELAIALAQYEIDAGVSGWLMLPWRDGWNACELALALERDTPHHRIYASARFELGDLVHQGRMKLINEHQKPEIYWKLQSMLEDRILSPLISATARCAQVMVTHNSAGDGSVFNAILRSSVETLEIHSDLIAPHVEEARCRDALGVGSSLQNDANDYLRRAFLIAWRRRLYNAAYALPPAGKP